MNKGKIIVIGIGPGSEMDITPAALAAFEECDVVVGYKYYFRFVRHLLRQEVECIDTGMRQEEARAGQAFEYAKQGKTVAVISSGDAGIYGMSPLVWEMKERERADIEVVVIPGISAFQKAASLLGAPIGHDFCVISLSDLMTSWERIDRRIEAAAVGDFVTAIYNPKSNGRYWQLYRLQEIFLKHRSDTTPVGYVRHAGREEQSIHTTTLKDFKPEEVDMFTIVIIGNSQSRLLDGDKMLTPRGYFSSEELGVRSEELSVGQNIMHESFRTIHSELRTTHFDLGHKWALLHAIHTTADFDMEQILYSDSNAVGYLHAMMKTGKLKHIVTDVSMALTGIRRAALDRLGIEVHCLLYDNEAVAMAKTQGITRTQAGIRLAAERFPEALYVFGNAPTALMELCSLVKRGKAAPSGVIAAPVGFVNVKESKYMIKSFATIPKLIVEGRKGGSNLAATLVNAILSFDDAEMMFPGRDL